MFATNPTTVIDLNEFLPPEGESSVTFQHDGSRLRVEIEFEDVANPSMTKEIALVFNGVVMMHVASVPGVNSLNLQCTGKHDVGNVVEYKSSDAASAWSAHFGWTIRHFHVYFAQQNKRLDVFAEDSGIES